MEENAPSWVRYIQALIQVAQENGLSIDNFKVVFGGNIPLGAGLSSSAAMGTGLLFGLSKLAGVAIEKWQIVEMAQAAEHKIGAMVGIMDQFAVVFGKKDHAMRLDCKDRSFEYFPIELDEYQLVLINSKVSHELSESAYNDRRATCESVRDFLATKENVQSVRDITSEMLKKYESDLSPIQIQRIKHVIHANDRVQQATTCLLNKDWSNFGKLLYQSHESLSKDYEVSCKKLDILVDLSREDEAVLGSRMMGGGFGGCTLNLIKRDSVGETVAVLLPTINPKQV